MSLTVAVVPASVHARHAPSPTASVAEPERPSEPETGPAGGAATEPRAEGDEAESPEGDAAPEADAPTEPVPEDEATTEPEDDQDAAGQAEPADGDADAADDTADADDTAAPGAAGPTAAPLRPMQTAAWWTMFGAFALGTTAGVLAGLAERQEDRATRLSTLFDAETGAQPLYADRKDEYEQYLRRGEGYAKAALGVGVVAGAATLAAITLFAIDAARQRRGAAPKKERRASWRLRGGGMEVRF